MASISASAMRRSAAENGVICICHSRCSRSVVGRLLRPSTSKSSSAPLFVRAWAAIGSSKLSAQSLSVALSSGSVVGSAAVCASSVSLLTVSGIVGALRRGGVGVVRAFGQLFFLEQRIAFEYLLDFLLQFDGGELQQADSLLQLGG